MFFKKYFLAVLFLAILITLFVLRENFSKSVYTSYSSLNWTESELCKKSLSIPVDNASRGLLTAPAVSEYTTCKTDFLTASDRFLSISYSADFAREEGGKRPILKIFKQKAVINEQPQEIFSKDLAPTSGIWKDVVIDLGEHDKNVPIYIELTNRLKKSDSILYVRDRVDFFSREVKAPSTFTEIAYDQLVVAFIKFFLLLVGSVYLFSTKLSSKGDSLKLFFILFALSLVQFFSSDSYYYFDEWHVLERYQKLGFPGVIYTHNEHFLPLFFTWYYLVTKIASSNYQALLVISSLLHATVAYSLIRFLNLFNDRERASEKLSVLAGLFFLLGAVHVETMEWAFEQSILLCMLSCIWSFIFQVYYMRSNNYYYLLASLLFLVLTPLLFGNGLVFMPLSLVFSALYFFLIENKGSLNFRMLLSKKWLSIWILTPVFSLVPIIFYLYNKPVGAQATTGFDILATVNYLVVGVGLASILRGIGIYPSMNLITSERFFSSFGADSISLIIDSLKPTFMTGDEFLGYLGVLLVLLVVFYVYITNKSKQVLLVTVFGLIFLVSSFLLPALARASLGETQSFALRYQYFSQFGLSLILAGLFYSVSQKFVRSFIIYFCFSLWLFEQSALVSLFSHFSSHGLLHHSYLDQLVDWEEQTKGFNFTSFEANTTDQQGLFPLARPSITPGRHPNELLRVYKGL